MRKFLITVMFCCLCVALVQAEEVVLKSGRVVEGAVLNRSNHLLKMDVGIGVDVTYYLDEVVSIDGEAVEYDRSAPYEGFAEEKVVTETLKNKAKFKIPAFNVSKGKMASIIAGLLGAGFSTYANIAFYILMCLPLQIMATRTATPHAWMAWVPFLNIYLICKLIDRPGYWVLLLFIPLVNLFFGFMFIFEIPRAMGKSGFLGLLLIFPGINLLVLWYLALSP